MIAPTDLGRFDSMVVPMELEAYDALKSRTGEEGESREPTWDPLPFVTWTISLVNLGPLLAYGS